MNGQLIPPSQALLIKIGRLESQSSVPLKSLNTQRVPVKQSAFLTTKPELAESSRQAGSPWSRAGGTTNTTTAATVANSADEVRLPGFAKHSAATESVPELEESFW